MPSMRLFASIILTATISQAQHLFTAVSSGIDDAAASAFLSQYDDFASSVVDDPRWTSATAELNTQAQGVAIAFSTNPLLLANDLFTATATPSWYPLLKPDLQSYVYSLASVEAGLYVEDKSIGDSGATTFPGLSAAIATSTQSTPTTPTTMRTIAQPTATVFIQTTSSSTGLSSGAKIGLGVGVGLGGLVIIGLIVFGLIWCQRRRKRARYSMSQGTTAVASRPMTYMSEPAPMSPKPYEYNKVELQGQAMPPEMGAGKFGPAYELPVQHGEQRPYELASNP